MTTITPVLHSRANKRGRYPLAIRITLDRKKALVFLGIDLNEKQWDSKQRKVKKNHPNSTRINALLQKRCSDISKISLNKELDDTPITAKQIRDIYLQKNEEGSFFKQATKHLDILKKEGKYNQYVSDEPRVQRFKELIKIDNPKFEDITVSVLDDFKADLIKEYKVSERTAINYLIVIRTIFNQGINNGLVDRKHYPFGKNKVPLKFPDSIKLGLSKEELIRLKSLDLKNEPKLNHIRNIWMTSFYFAGMRISDVLRLKWNDFQDGRLHYRMGKNQKVGSLLYDENIETILMEYEEQKDESNYVFPELKELGSSGDKYTIQRKISYKVKTINKYLREIAKLSKITKPLTTHIARHTFGSLSGDKIPIQMLQKLYRHTDIQTTIEYQKSFIFKDTDQAHKKVINLEIE